MHVRSAQTKTHHLKACYKNKNNAGELKRKSALDKQFKLKLSNIYSNKLSKFKSEKQLNTIR